MRTAILGHRAPSQRKLCKFEEDLLTICRNSNKQKCMYYLIANLIAEVKRGSAAGDCAFPISPAVAGDRFFIGY